MRVRDVMTVDVVTAQPEDSLKEAARLMVENRISGVPVTDGRGVLVGIITEADFLVRQPGPRRRLLSLFFDEEAQIPAETIGDAMTPKPVVIFPDATLAETGRTLASHGVKRLPVVDVDGKVVGIVSRSDIVKAFARPDELIEDEIREDLIQRILLFDPELIEVSVDDGVVALGGNLPEKGDVRLLEELARRLDGVVRVDSKLRWDADESLAGPSH